jgi:hypothetical protein
MSSTTMTRRTGPAIPGETRICIPGVNWRFYEWLVDSIPEGTGVRVAFDGTDVEIMSTSPEHEDFVDLSPSELDRPGIYAALEVAEVWRFNGIKLRIDRLSSRGRNTTVTESKLLPVHAEQVRRWIIDEDASDLTSWSRRVRRWVRDELAKTD